MPKVMQKKLIELFLRAGVPFGVFMGLYWYFRLDASPVRILVLALAAGILFGGFMAGILGSWHIISVKRKASGGSEEDYNVKQSKEIEIPVSYDTAYELCIKSLEKLKKPEIVTTDYSNGIVTAKTGITWDTFGDTVSFKLTENTESTTNIVVSSEPLSYQVVDYGKNLDNVNAVLSFLEGQKV